MPAQFGFSSDNPLYPNYKRPGEMGKGKIAGSNGKPGKWPGRDRDKWIVWVGLSQP